MSSAQGTSTGAIAGTARDTSGAVLPGVTVEASSPALIEKSRTTVTDDNGEYKIIELRPGTYTVTFTLPGFNTFKRDGLELAPNFTATINAVLAVGAIQETVTVSGSTPLVDTQNVSQQRTFSRELLDAVPTAKSMLGIASLMPSVVEPPNAQDVGGSKGERSVRLSVHGSKTYDSRLLQDGMRYNALTPGIGPPAAPATLFVPSLEGTGRGYYINPLAAEETLIDTGSLGSAQYQYGGAQVNMIPKDGGNTFSGSVFFGGTGSGLQSNNLTDDLQSQGLTSVNAVRQGVRRQRRIRRPNREGSHLVLRVGAPLGHDDGCGEPVCRCQPLGSWRSARRPPRGGTHRTSTTRSTPRKSTAAAAFASP